MPSEACTFYSHHRKTIGATIFVLKNSCSTKILWAKVNAIKVESFFFFFFLSFFWGEDNQGSKVGYSNWCIDMIIYKV